MNRLLVFAAAAALAFASVAANAQQDGSTKISFRRTVLDTVFRAEGVAASYLRNLQAGLLEW